MEYTDEEYYKIRQEFASESFRLEMKDTCGYV